MNDATVSVVITCYNQGHFLSEAIESVLAQSYSDFELIVVDDGSTDNTAQIAKKYPQLRYVYQGNQGLPAARNTGIKHCRGAYVVFLDADDRLVSIALQAGVQTLRAHPECAFVSGHFSVIRSNGQLQPQSRPVIAEDHYAELLRGNYIGMHATVMYRRSILESFNGFDTALKACEDYELYLRIARIEPVYCHDKIIAEYRHHEGALSRNRALMLKFSVMVLRSQRKYLRDVKHVEAFKSGIRFWQGLYGDRLIREMRASISINDWSHVVRNISVLLRYYPRGFVYLVRQLPIRTVVAVPGAFFRMYSHRR